MVMNEAGIYVFGSGRDFALGALAMGASAYEAVKAAITFDITCGIGVDTLTLDGLSF